MKKINYWIAGILILTCLKGHALNHAEDELNELYRNNQLIKATLTFDFKLLNKERDTKSNLPAKFGIYLADETFIERPVEIRPRGHYRRENCQYLPLRLDFSESSFEIPGWDELGKVKLVLRCKKPATYNQFVIKEWLIYRMYALFTDQGYGTCLLDLKMIDSEGKKKPIQTYAFILEETDELAERLQAVEVEEGNVNVNMIERGLMNLVSVFEFMVGNLDWSAPMMHNVKLFRPEGEGRQWIIPVPYDFDFSGFVNAFYATPPPELPVESVRERLFRGFCRPEHEYREVFDLFLEKRDEINALIEDCPYLSQSMKNDANTYIRQFYNIIESDAQIKKEIFDQCR